MMRFLSSLGCLVLLACGGGGAVDLGGNSGWANTRGSAAASTAAPSVTNSAPAAPQTLYDGGDTVQAIAVDETTIAALIVNIRNPTTIDERMLKLTARIDLCQFADCQGTQQTIATLDAFDVLGGGTLPNVHVQVLISHGELIWLQSDMRGTSAIMACSTAGCPQGPRQIASVGALFALAADADFVYWLDGGSLPGVARCARAGCPSPEISPAPDAAAAAMEYSLSTVAVVDETHRVLYHASGRSIGRVPTDFSAAPSLFYEDSSTLEGLAIVGDYVYFARSTLIGQILRCPVTGCDAGPELVVPAPRWPARIAADGRGIYWMNKANTAVISPGSGSEHGDFDIAAISVAPIDGSSGARALVSGFHIDTSSSRCAGPVINSHHLYWCEVTGAVGSERTLNIRTMKR